MHLIYFLPGLKIPKAKQKLLYITFYFKCLAGARVSLLIIFTRLPYTDRTILHNSYHVLLMHLDLLKGPGEGYARYYLLGKGGYVFGSFGLSVCLSVDNITQKVINGLG